MLILDSLLVGGLKFVFDKIVRAAEAEAQEDAGRSRARLLQAQMRLERGEITPEAFDEAEREFVAALAKLRGAAQGPISMPAGGAEVECSVRQD